MKLTVGIGDCGERFLRYITSTSSDGKDVLLITDTYILQGAFIPCMVTDQTFEVIQAFDTPCKSVAFEAMLEAYSECRVFVGLGSEYTLRLLERCLEGISPATCNKIEMIGMMPLSFEGRVVMQRAQQTQALLASTLPRCHFFSKEALLDLLLDDMNIKSATETFYQSIIDTLRHDGLNP